MMRMREDIRNGRHSGRARLWAALFIAVIMTARPTATAFAEIHLEVTGEKVNRPRIDTTESVMDVLCEPSGILSLSDGSFLVTDTYNKVVWRVVNGKSEVFAGKAGVEDFYGEPMGGYQDGIVEESLFREPWDIEPFAGGYAVSDAANNVVRLIQNSDTKTATGSLTIGLINGSGTGTRFNRPTGLASDENGNLYVSDTNNQCIRKVDPQGTVTTYYTGLSEPMGLCYAGGALYVAEAGQNRIVRIQDGQLAVVAGSGEAGYLDGEALLAGFSSPQGVEVAEDGSVYVADTGNSIVRKVKDGVVSTIAIYSPDVTVQYPAAPRGMMIRGEILYICDNYSRKLFAVKR